jgi:hypothetical protein
MHREQKTAGEIQALLWAEFRKHPECANITAVTVRPHPVRGWEADFMRSNKHISMSAKCNEIVLNFKENYDLRA